MTTPTDADFRHNAAGEPRALGLYDPKTIMTAAERALLLIWTRNRRMLWLKKG